MKLNFKEFKAFVDIKHTQTRTADVREQFADMVYKNVNGIRALVLAQKIYQSTGAEEYTPVQVQMIKTVANSLCLPSFIEGLTEQINNNSKQ